MSLARLSGTSRVESSVRRLMRLSIVLAAALATIALADPPSRAGAAHASTSCAWGEAPARIGGVARCLRDGNACRTSASTAYRRAGFTCRNGFLDFDWSTLRRRPVNVPQLEPGAPCPLSARTRGLPGYPRQPAWGPGPAWPFIGGEHTRPRVEVELPAPPEEGGEWGVRKVMWAIDPRYVGPVLVRGRQLDGPNEVRFENGSPGFTIEQRLHPVAELRLQGGFVHPATTRVRALGCYAWQIDGIGFSRRIVFVAEQP